MASKIATVSLDSGVQVFYRQAGNPSKSTVLLLHGFPTSSFQFRNLIPLIASTGRYNVIAPDLPGFGFTKVPEGYKHTFDGMKNVVRDFVDKIGVKEFVVYIFDYGAPTALR
jgi:pimeloyl-ACP methyl ester carboxylesterase